MAAVAVFIGSVAPALADDAPRGIDLPACKTIVTKVVAATGATDVRIAARGSTSVLSLPQGLTAEISCSAGMRPAVFMIWHGAFPPNAFFATLAKAGAAVTRETAPTLLKAAHRCHVAALKSPDETSEINLPHAELDGQAFTRDGGSASVTISLGKDDATP